mmetsp:Transcript_24911/g.41520  ORF Transcript_24911/g.41520 Transcript_24911/m.41520 type:complete len:113 (+) Transcript_24911:75-413(+)
MTYVGYAKCCSIFSLSGIVFLVIVGSLLQTQPIYIKGPTDTEGAARGCYQGAMLYVATFLLSLGYWIFDSLRAKAPQSSSNSINARLSSYSGGGGSSNSFGGKYGAVVSDSF